MAARAAAELQAGSGIPSTTLARLFLEVDNPLSRPGAGSVIVIDEAGMVGTRQLHHLAQTAEIYGWKLVLVGDPAQLPEIDAGGAFSHLVGRVPTWRLDTNLRQTEAWERAALDRLRARQPSPAIAAYQTAGRVTITATAAERVERMVTDWHHATEGGADAIMLATRRNEVDTLNTAAQRLRAASGNLNPDKAVDVGGRVFMVGDRVLCTRNDRKHDLINGARFTITHVNPAISITAATLDKTKVVIPWSYLEQGHLALGYAFTVHKAQGMTVDEAFLLGDDRLFAEAGYVGLSRGRRSNRLYVVAQPDPERPLQSHDEIDHVIAALGVTKAQALSTAAVPTSGKVATDCLGWLVTERDRLVEVILADVPPDPTGRLRNLDEARRAINELPQGTPWVADELRAIEQEARTVAVELRDRHEWAARHRREGERLAAISTAIDRRLSVITQAVAAGPDPHLIDMLGPQPDQPAERRRWVENAARIEAWREITGKPPAALLESPDQALGDDWWDRARRALAPYLDNSNDQRQGI